MNTSKRFYFMIGLLCLACIPCSAGGNKLVRQAGKLVRSGVMSAGKSALPKASQGVERALTSAVQQEARRASGKVMIGGGRAVPANLLLSFEGQKLVLQEMYPSLVQVIHPVTEEVLSSGFVFEEFTSGKSRLWAAVPYHVVGRAGNSIMLRLFRSDGSRVKYRVDVAVSGGYGFTAADVSLCLLPSYARSHVVPLQVAQQAPVKGQTVNGFGFAVQESEYLSRVLFNVFPNLSISGVGNYNMVAPATSSYNLSGMCGSPYLDESGRVVGIHSGSVVGKSVNMVNAYNAINDLLTQYNNHTVVTRGLVFNGKKVADIKLGESVNTVRIMQDGKLVFEENMQRYAGALNYDQLEKTIPAQKGDIVQMRIVIGRKFVRKVEFTVP